MTGDRLTLSMVKAIKCFGAHLWPSVDPEHVYVVIVCDRGECFEGTQVDEPIFAGCPIGLPRVDFFFGRTNRIARASK